MTDSAISEPQAAPEPADAANGAHAPAVAPLLGVTGAGVTVACSACGNEAEPLHRGCTLCEECCDCRP